MRKHCTVIFQICKKKETNSLKFNRFFFFNNHLLCAKVSPLFGFLNNTHFEICNSSKITSFSFFSSIAELIIFFLMFQAVVQSAQKSKVHLHDKLIILAS